MVPRSRWIQRINSWWRWLVLAAVATGLCAMVIGWLLWATWEVDRGVGTLAARWAPPPSTFIELDRMQVHLRDQGPKDDPQPIVLLHGVSSSLHTWEPWVHTLAQTRRVITLDLPGFGLTGPHPQNDYHIETYARFVLRLLDLLNIQRCVLGGHDQGGEIAWATGVLDRYRIEKLILINSRGYPTNHSGAPLAWRVAESPLMRWFSTRILPKSLIETSLKQAWADNSKVTPALVDRFFELTLRTGNREALAIYWAQASDGKNIDQIKLVTQPTLIIWGAKDTLLPLDHGQHFQRDILESELVVIPNAGHSPQEEFVQESLQNAQRFLAQ